MFNTISFFQTYRVSEQPSQHQVRIATGVQIPVLGFGTLPGKHSALYVPQLADNILSVSELDKSGFSTLFEQDTATVYQRNNKAILFLIHRDIDSGLYTVNQSQFEAAFQLTHRVCLSHYCSNLNPLMRAHYIYGHPSAARTRYICKCLGLKVNLTSRALDCIRNCDICHLVKIKRQKVLKHIERNTILGKVWHHDIKGPFSTASLHYGHHYQSAYRESKSRYTVLYFVTKKSDVYTTTQSWIKDYIVPLRATNPNLGPVFIISDMGEFNSTRIREELLSPNGILSNTTCPYVPAHNGVIERFWRTLSDATVCQLIASALSEEFWEESARCANYIINRLVGAHPEVNPHSPYEVYFGVTPRISHFRIFGSVCYVKDLIAPKQPRPKGTRGIFVGYEERQTVGYRIYLPTVDKFIVNFHVEFSDADNLFPGLQIPQSTNDTNANNYDNVLRETNDLNPPEDSIKEPRPSCKESSPAADETRTLRRSARLRDPDTKAFVSVHNYAHPVDSPGFHSPSETNNTSLRVALDDIGNIQCNDP